MPGRSSRSQALLADTARPTPCGLRRDSYTPESSRTSKSLASSQKPPPVTSVELWSMQKYSFYVRTGVSRARYLLTSIKAGIPAGKSAPAYSNSWPRVVYLDFVAAARRLAKSGYDHDVLFAVCPQRAIASQPAGQGVNSWRHRRHVNQAQSPRQRNNLRILDSLVCPIQIDSCSIDCRTLISFAGPVLLLPIQDHHCRRKPTRHVLVLDEQLDSGDFINATEICHVAPKRFEIIRS
ncbi:hypothetical protein CI41S_48770 [Bradyrhizobium ivorense]|nr:hypothetical protein CI41S_48770 [Bradyrhizobium ivorense]